LTWYSSSYPEFVKLFGETRVAEREAWVRRVAAIYSWLPRIPAWRYDQAATELFLDLEISLDGLSLETMDAELPEGVSEDEIRDNYHPKRRLVGPDGTPSIDPCESLRLANAVLHGRNARTVRVSSSSKLLHLACPRVFPILDRRISGFLFGSSTPRQMHYHAYVSLVQEQLTQSPFKLLRGQSEWLHKLGVTPVRVFENLLFRLSELGTPDKD
jgi:hypothetical protein